MKVLASLVLVSAMASVASAQVTTLDDFSAVTNSNDTTSPVAGVWYDNSDNAASGIATVSDAGEITDGGFSNGVYAEMTTTIPATGDFVVKLDILDLSEDPTQLNGIRGYEVGVVINGVHRSDDGVADGGDNINNDNPVLTAEGASNLTYDATDNSISGSPADTITTSQFSATIGDTIFIILACDVSAITSNSGTWGTSSITVDDLRLEQMTSVSDWYLF